MSDELIQQVRKLNAELEQLREIDKAVRRLFNGSREFMADGDVDQWRAYDFLKRRVCNADVVSIDRLRDKGAL